MTEHPIEIFKAGAIYVAHRPTEPGHDCALDDSLHGQADTAVGALRRLIAAEQ